MFLTDAQVRQLTGYKVAPKQIRWLQQHGIPFVVNAQGKPVIVKDAVPGARKDTFELGEVS